MQNRHFCNSPLRLLLFVLVLVLPMFSPSLVPKAQAASVFLSWDKNIENDLAGYNIYQRLTPSFDYGSPVFSGMPENPSFPSRTISGLNENNEYGFIATAFDQSGNESSSSNEVLIIPGNSNTPPDPTGKSFFINFQPTTAAVPSGFQKDDGSLYDPARGYGWDHPVESIKRNANADPLLDSFSRLVSGQNATWVLDVPNGDYLISLASGDPSFAQGPHQIAIEGVPALNSGTEVNNFLEISDQQVEIQDGQLTIELTRTSNSKTHLNYVVLKPLSTSTFPLFVSLVGEGSVTSNQGGLICGAGLCDGDYAQGTTVTLTPNPDNGWTFNGWTGGGCSGAGNCQVTLSSVTQVIAIFTPSGTATAPVTISKNGAGSGTVTSDPAGLTCGSTCTANFATGATVTLTANAASGSAFDGWNGGGCNGGSTTCTVTVTQATTVTATFSVAQTNSSDPALLTPTPGGMLPGATATFVWTPNTTPVLEWWLHVGTTQGAFNLRDTGSLGTSLTTTLNNLPTNGNPVWVRLWYRQAGGWSSTDVQYTAFSTATTVPVTISKNGAGSGTVTSDPAGLTCGNTCTANFATGATVTLTANAASGSAFDGWNGGGCNGGSTTCTVTVTQATTVTATFSVAQTNSSDPALLTPTPGGMLPGATATFVWTPNTTPVLEWWLHVGTTQGAFNLRDTGSLGTSLTTTLNNLPTNGNPVWVRLWYRQAGGWSSTDVQYTAFSTATTVPVTISKNGAGSGTVTSDPAGLTCGNTCTANFATGATVTLTANAASGSAFDGWNGGGCNGGSTTCTVTVTQATTVTATFSVAQTNSSDPALLTPTPGGMLPGATATFVWTPNTTPVLEWWLHVGTTQGAFNLRDTGSLGTSLTTTLNNLPTNGNPVWVRLWYRQAGGWSSTDVQYTAFSTATTVPVTISKNGAGSGTVTSDPAGLTCGSTCTANFATGATVTLTANAASGSAFDGWNGGGCNGGSTTCTVTVTQATTVTATFLENNPNDPSITSPGPNSILSGSNVTFTWTPNNTPVLEWWLHVGTTQGAFNLRDTGSLGTSLTTTVNNLPTNGNPVWVRLWYRLTGGWSFTDAQYTAFNPVTAGPTLLTPLPGSSLSGGSATFIWTSNNTPVAEWWLYVGSSQGEKNYLNSGSLSSETLSRQVSGLPTDGSPIWVQLWWREAAGGWQSDHFRYNE